MGVPCATRLIALTMRCLVAEWGGESAACLAHAPGAHDGVFPYAVWLEVLRATLLYAAFARLRWGGVYGGQLEVEALENARLDAADGSLDHKVDREYLRALRNLDDVESGYSELMHRQKSIARSQMDAAIAVHRAELEVPFRDGGKLGWFMLWDLCVLTAVMLALVAVASSTLADAPSTAGATATSQLLWTLIYFANFGYAFFSSAPFLAFHVPILGTALHGAEKTGYDASGTLAPCLSSGLLRQKIAAEKEIAEYHQRKPKDRKQAAAVIQRHHARQRKERERAAAGGGGAVAQQLPGEDEDEDGRVPEGAHGEAAAGAHEQGALGYAADAADEGDGGLLLEPAPNVKKDVTA